MSVDRVSRRRYVGILSGVSTAMLSRGLAVALSLLSVSLVLPYLGAERFGAWATIATTQIWLQLADFGLSAGVTTPISLYLARGDVADARKMLATTLCAVSIGCLIVFGLFAFLIFVLGVTEVFHFRDLSLRAEFDTAALVAIGVTLLGTPNAIVTRVLLIQQRPRAANSWQIGGQFAALIGVLLCARAHCGIVTLTVVMVSFPAVASLACTVWFFRCEPALRFTLADFDKSTLMRVWRISASYSLLQLAGMMLLNSSIFLAGSVISASAAAEFAVTNRLASVCTIVVQLVAPYFWAAYTDAIVREDYTWLRRAFRHHVAASVAIAAVISICLLVTAPWVIASWTRGQMRINAPLLWWSLAWQAVIAIMNPVSALLNAYDKYGVQTVASLASGLLALWLGVRLAEPYGVAGIVAATTISYIVLTVFPIWLQAKRLLSVSCASIAVCR
jgi:O-antigen/teichoic acid export membrane protein